MKILSSSKSKEHSPPLLSAPPVSILVYRNDLKSVVGNGLPKVGWFARRKLFRTWKRVDVEPAPSGAKDSIFYAPISNSAADSRATPTEFINIDADQHAEDIVRQGDDFEISFVGMSVTPQDTVASNNNELLLYSLSTDSSLGPRNADNIGLSLENLDATSPPPLASMLKKRSMRSSYYTGPTGFAPAPTDVPFIHYDPVIDGHDIGNEPDAFVPIPATKSLYVQRTGREGIRRKEPEKSVFIRFSVLEIDKVSDGQVRAISGISDMGSLIGQGAVAAPYLELVSGAFQIASLLGQKGLEKYSRPDHVMSKDVEFKLGEPRNLAEERSETSDDSSIATEGSGNYLRYGYYFFLNKSIDAKLYAQTGSSSQSVPLLLKRHGFHARTAPKNEKPYFPLTGVSYVVVKVSHGISRTCPVDRSALRQEHRRRLDTMLQMSNMMEMFATMDDQKGSRTQKRNMRQRRGKPQ